ncbi:DHHW family protein [Ruminococcus sp.]|uniref:DHHW family protein n=1 Tax=Ruminococcus sp. TaxID=41978 RepID=UPI0025F32ABC|nr:DHHW family protein [Ruminococcus sp.]
MTSITKITSRITAIVTIAFIVVMSYLTFFHEKDKFSFFENRVLTEFPIFSEEGLINGSDIKQLGAYITDHFAGRSRWISAKTIMQTELSEKVVNGVYVSSERLLDAETSQRTPVSFNADIFCRYAEQYDGTVYFTAIPSSSGVYGDLFQGHTDTRSESQQISSFYEFLNNDIKKIDAYNILKMLNDNYIFYRNDTKWTTYGAYCVYKTVIQKLGFQPTSYDKYNIEHITDKFRGNLYQRTLSEKPKADTIDIFKYPNGAIVYSCIKKANDGSTKTADIYDRSRLDSSDMYSVFLGEPAPMIKITTSVKSKSDKKLLVIKDSYANCFIPFLIQHYSEIVVVSPEDMQGTLSDYVDINEYSQTLFLFGVENLGNRDALKKIIERN